MLMPPPELIFEDQYAFRPTGSATAALIATINKVTELIRSGYSVVLLSLDFSKAFDRVRHKTLFEKYELLDIDDFAYNWIVSYFEDRSHNTKFFGEVSSMRRVNDSVVQGSVMGPASYSIAESNLKPRNSVFSMFKFADDVDLITILDHHDQIPAEMEHIAEWAEENNRILNRTKTKEIILNKGRRVRPLPPPIAGIDRVTTMKKLGVTLQSNLSMKIHVEDLISKCSNMMYPMNILRQHGMAQDGLQQVFNCKITSRLTYASPAWFGFPGQEEISRINAFLRRAARFGFYPVEGMTFQELCHTADDRLFKKITNNCNHVLYKVLPEKKQTHYELGKRVHDYKLPAKDDRSFIHRVLFKNII